MPPAAPYSLLCSPLRRPTHVQGRVQLRVVQVEDVEHQHFQRVGGDEAVMGPQQPALVVAPRLELQGMGCVGGYERGKGDRSASSMAGGLELAGWLFTQSAAVTGTFAQHGGTSWLCLARSPSAPASAPLSQRTHAPAVWTA